ncbi:24962_t:CDS:2, partial [Dentiscutata erythropus]
EVTGVFIPPVQNNKREEAKMTGNPPEKKRVASSYTPMMCKSQVSSWTIDIIIDSGSSISIISKAFVDHINRQPDRISTRTITGIHGDPKGSLGIINDIPVHLGDVIISTDMEVIDTRLNALSLIVTEDESSDNYYYCFDPWGIEIDHDTFSWEEYQFMNEKFNPWLKDQKYRHAYKHWFKGPDKSCWCNIKLITKEDECKQCEEDYNRWCTLQ